MTRTKNSQYEKLTPSLAASLGSWITAVPSAVLTLSLLRDRNRFEIQRTHVKSAEQTTNKLSNSSQPSPDSPPVVPLFNNTFSIWGVKKKKSRQYSLELRVEHLNAAVFPHSVVGLDALSSLEGRGELGDLIPPAEILSTHTHTHTERLHQLCAV